LATRPYLLRRPLLLLVLLYILLLCLFPRWRVRSDAPGVFPDDTQKITVRGRVAASPEPRPGGQRFLLRLTQHLLPDGSWAPLEGRVMVSAPSTVAVGWGDAVEVEGRRRAPREATVPGAYSEKDFLARQGLGDVVEAEKIHRFARASVWDPRRWMTAARERWLEAFEKHLTPRSAAILSGLVLGKKPADFPAVDAAFRRSGAYHLLVASGSNVGFVLGIWFLIARWFLPRKILWTLAVPVAFLYAGVTGGQTPVVRAAVMVSVGILAYLLGREDRPEQAVGLSAAALLLWRPASLFEPSFQMSYAAVLGVALGVPATEALAPRAFWLRWPYRLFALSAAAQLALSPVLLHWFHRFSWTGLWSNLLCVPWAGLCLIQGTVLFAADLLLPPGPLVTAAAWGAEAMTTGFWRLVELFSQAPGAEVTIAWSGRQTALLGVLLAVTFLAVGGRRFPAEKRRRARAALGVAGMWVLGAPALYALRPAAGDGRLSVVWLDAGLGDAIVVTSPRGRVTVVDGGDERAARYRLIPYLRHRGVARVDRMILTHADPPHAGGLEVLLDALPVGEFLCAASAWDDPLWAQGRRRVEARRLPVRLLSAGDQWTEDGAAWRVLWPRPEASDEPDFQSLVLEIGLGTRRAVLSADLPLEAQEASANELTRPVSVLQWPHHGLAPLSPRWASAAATLVASGPGDPERLKKAPARTTARDGTLEWRTDGRTSQVTAALSNGF